nr:MULTISPECIES: uridine diphosphate-N-acetylglucosamine-binding protein YvcK [Lactobacillaceae]
MATNRIVRVVKGRRPKVVVIGGGTGLPVILNSLRNKDAEITAIVTVADDGGSSGIIRDYINVVPPGDIRNVLASLSDLPDVELDVFQYRFKSNDDFFAGHAIGNLIIAALTEMSPNIFDAVQELSKMMKIDGRVFPASNTKLTLNAEFTDGSVISGEHDITHSGKHVKRVWVTNSEEPEKEPESLLPVIASIMQADVIVLGPGSLFTSILPNLMIKELGEAMRQTSAEIVYVCNIMTQIGETEGFTDADHVQVINDHLGGNYVDTVLVNTAPIPNDYMDLKKYDEYVKQVETDYKRLREMGCRVVQDNFLSLHNKGAFHNGDKITEEILNLAMRSGNRKNEVRS